MYGVLLRPLPYPDPDRLVELFEDNRTASMPRFRVSTLKIAVLLATPSAIVRSAVAVTIGVRRKRRKA